MLQNLRNWQKQSQVWLLGHPVDDLDDLDDQMTVSSADDWRYGIFAFDFSFNEYKESNTLGFVYRSAAVDGFGKPGKSAAAAAVTLTTQGEMCI